MAALIALGIIAGVWGQSGDKASANPAPALTQTSLTDHSPPLATAPVTPEPVVSPSKDNAIRETLERWRLDWSRRDVSAYLAHYSSQFEPAESIERADWEAQRRQALLKRPAIRVEVADLSIEYPKEQEAWVRFRQTYLSGRYQEIAQPKTLRLLREDGGWRIAGEWQGAGPAELPRKP